MVAPSAARIVVVTRKKAGEASRASAEPIVVTRKMLSAFFDRPLRQASKELGISLTALKSLCRKLEISRWPFRQARWISERVRKDLRKCDVAVDIQINEGASTSAQHSNVLTAMQGNRLCDAVSQRELEFEMWSLFSSMPLKDLTYYDQSLDRALRCRFDEGDMPDLLARGSTRDLLSVCNTPPPTAQEQEPTTLLTPTRRQTYAPAGASDAAMCYGQVQRASRVLGGSRELRVQHPCWFDPFTAADEADSEMAENPEMRMMAGYTDCDLSYLNVFS